MLSEPIELPTEHGVVSIKHFEALEGSCVVVQGAVPLPEVPLVRIHSSCMFSESLGAIDCDCASQLKATVAKIAREGGIVIYSWEEGRGIGIKQKIAAIRLQQTEGVGTVAAFAKLHYTADPRTHVVAAAALRALGIGPKIRLITRNPRKISALEQSGFEIERVSLEVELGDAARAYVDEKCKSLGHHADD